MLLAGLDAYIYQAECTSIPTTILAPTDAAFQAAFKSLHLKLGEFLKHDLLVTRIMHYNVLPLGAYTTDDLDDGMTFPTALSEDSSLTFRKHDDGEVAFTTTFGNGQEAKVRTRNVMVEAGPVVVHITSTVLLPPGVKYDVRSDTEAGPVVHITDAGLLLPVVRDNGGTDTETTGGGPTGTSGGHDD
jgi:hypothetical protein